MPRPGLVVSAEDPLLAYPATWAPRALVSPHQAPAYVLSYLYLKNMGVEGVMLAVIFTSSTKSKFSTRSALSWYSLWG